MTTPSGQIYLSQVNDELRQPGTQYITMGDERVRLLAEVWGQIYMSQLRGKNAMTNNIGADYTVSGYSDSCGYRTAYLSAVGSTDNPYFKGVEVVEVTTNSVNNLLQVIMYGNLPQWTHMRYVEVWYQGALQIRRHVDQMNYFAYNASNNTTEWHWDNGGFVMGVGYAYQVRIYD